MRQEIKFGREPIILETGKFAKQAGGSVTVQHGGTVVLVSACVSKEVKEGMDFMPLFVEYQEKTYAAGKIPGGFFKREGRPSENEILTSRLIDRSIRPLFPKGLFNEIQVMAIVLSSDGQNDPNVISIIGASVALTLSETPFNGPVASCRVGRIDSEFILNPTYDELQRSDLDLVISLTAGGVVMLESKSNQVSEDVFIKAIEFGSDSLKSILNFEDEFCKGHGKQKLSIEYKDLDTNLLGKIKQLYENRLIEVYKLPKKEEREEAVALLSKELEEKFTPEGYLSQDIKRALVQVEREQVRRYILERGARIDGRNLHDIRPISCEAGVLPRTHGSCLFTRGQTQSLSVTTLGTGEDQQLIEALEGETHKSFMLHYSFPPFSVGEIAPIRGPGRREVGHGALAERALLAVMPKKEQFPYTIRVVSEILESNGSSSMATICAASLSLMDAGVPVKEAVAGIALGLIKEDDKATVLTDITGLEDHFGDMDFKVAGTKDGITAVQLDLKIEGIGIKLLKKCLEQAQQARFFVLDKMRQVLPRPREELSIYAPRIEMLKINPEKTGELIGPGGKTIKNIINLTGVTIDIQEGGNVLVASTNSQQSQKAIEMIKAITDDVEVGRVYAGTVKRILAFGAFCEIAPGKEGLIHISELADHFVKSVEDEVKIGEEVKVKVIGIDELGRINLSKKQAQESSDSRKSSKQDKS